MRLTITALSLGIVVLAATALPRRGEVPPELYERIVADLELRGGPVDRTEAGYSRAGYYRLTELRSEAVVWPDDGLGCPGVPATGNGQPVRGYWVMLQVGASVYDYRARADQTFELCEGPAS